LNTFASRLRAAIPKPLAGCPAEQADREQDVDGFGALGAEGEPDDVVGGLARVLADGQGGGRNHQQNRRSDDDR